MPSELSETELSYFAFTGDVVFRIDDAVFDALWGWIPLVDFVLGLQLAMSNLRTSLHVATKIDFTETDETISLVREADNVVVSADYAPATAQCRFDELAAAADRATLGLLKTAAHRWPPLVDQPPVAGLLRELSARGIDLEELKDN